MGKEYTRAFSITKLYELISTDEDTELSEVNPFNTSKINTLFYDFCDKWLPKDYDEHEEAWEELIDIFREIEQNAFSVGFEIAVNLTK